MLRKQRSIVEQLAAKVIRLGVEELEVEYKDGYEEVFAVKGALGVGIASLRSSSPQAVSLRRELYSITKKKRRLTIGDSNTSCALSSMTASARTLFACNCDESEPGCNSLRGEQQKRWQIVNCEYLRRCSGGSMRAESFTSLMHRFRWLVNWV